MCTRSYLKSKLIGNSIRDVYQVVSNIGQLFEGYPSFVTQELGSILPPEYQMEAIDHSSVRFYAPNTDPVIIEVRRPGDSERQRTPGQSAAETNDAPKTLPDRAELEKVGSTESWVTKVKVGPPVMHAKLPVTQSPQNRFSGNPQVYRQILEILRDAQGDARSTQAAYSAAKELFGANKDMINEFEILVAKGELKLDEPLLQSVRSVFRYATASSDETHIDRGEESQRSKEAAEVDNKGRASDSTQILCYVCREAGSGNMIQCDNTDVSIVLPP